MLTSNILPSRKTYKAEESDYLSLDLNEYQQYFEKSEKVIKEYGNIFYLSRLGYNNWKVLDKLFDAEWVGQLEVDAAYICPFSDNNFYALYPVAILTHDASQYIEKSHYLYDLSMDGEWNMSDRENLHKSLYFTSNPITRAFLGSCSTQMFYPTDGSYYFDNITIQLENGDSLLCVVIRWYNK